MRPRYGKKSVLYKRRWVYIAGMMSFEPLNTIFGRNFHKLYQIRVISKIEKNEILISVCYGAISKAKCFPQSQGRFLISPAHIFIAEVAFVAESFPGRTNFKNR